MYVPISKKSDRLILLLFLAKIESLVYHYLNKYPILFNFGHKFVFWDQCANFLSKVIIVHIFEKPSLIINHTDFYFISAESKSHVYHYLCKYPILLHFGHKFVLWDQCANFTLKIIIVHIF